MTSRRSLAFLIAAVAAAQLWLAHRYYGFLTGDDVEVLAEAFRVGLGFHYRAWDIRNVFVPDFFVAPFLFVAHAAGVQSPRLLSEIAVLPFIALTAITIVLVFRLTREWSGDDWAPVAAAALFALHWIPLGFGATVYPRTLATACVVAAALLVAQRRLLFLAGVLVGLAFADRFSEIVFLVPLVLAAFARGDRRAAARNALTIILGAAVAIIITVGLFDWYTWGAPFSSVIKFARLTVVAPDFASRVKYQPLWWYLAYIARWCSPALLPLLLFCRKREPWLYVAIPFIALCAVRHKELRYLQALIPFLAIAAAIGFAELLRRKHRAIAVALLAISIIWNLSGIRLFAHKSMPAVMAGEWLGADARVHTVVLEQLWAYGERMVFGERMQVRDVGTPPRDLDAALPGADAAAMYESDLDPPVVETLRRNGFAPVRTFRDGGAKAVVVFRRVGG